MLLRTCGWTWGLARVVTVARPQQQAGVAFAGDAAGGSGGGGSGGGRGRRKR